MNESLYKIYVNIKGEGFEQRETLPFPSLKDAKEYAFKSAKEIYYWHPKRDMIEIMKEDEVNEDVAYETFHKEMMNEIVYLAEVDPNE